jgi:hypothetical protein
MRSPIGFIDAAVGALRGTGLTFSYPLSANEYQPADRQTAGVTAWYLARFAQSGYTNAMRGNWVCCTIPNLTGVLTQSGGTWQPTGNWWAMRSYADLTGDLVATSGQVNSTAVSASVDGTNKRVVAVVGDSNGYPGSVSVAFNGLSSLSWLAGSGSVDVVVDRIPDQAPLASPQVVFNQTVSASGGSVAVPLTFQASHDAFAIYLTPASSGGGGFPTGYHQLTVANDSLCLDVYGTGTNLGQQLDQWQFKNAPGTNQDFVPR